LDYGYKLTTHGRRVLAACLDLGAPLRLTRAAVGGGLIDRDEDLAKAHALIHYAAEASIADRRHEEDRLFLTVRYSNQDHPEAETFTLSEFMVWAEDPETGRETDFLYATLGDFRQPVPAYSEAFPASVWSFPLVLVVSSDLQVSITASPGLVTYTDLLDLRTELLRSIMMNELALPLANDAGEALLSDGGTPIQAVYHPDKSAGLLESLAALDGRLSGQITRTASEARAYADSVGRTALAGANTYTDGKVLDLERRMNTDAGSVTGQIAAAKAEAVSEAGKAADAKIAAHNVSTAAHPTHLAIVKKS